MSELEKTTTYAELMVTNLSKIAEALEELRATPLPRELILLYVQKRTRLGKKDILSVFNAIDELHQKVKQKTQ